MRQLTIRNIPEHIEKDIKREARKKNVSLNKACISVLEKATGRKTRRTPRKAIFHDLDHLCGMWSARDSRVFEENLSCQRDIDKDLWKQTG